MTAALECLHNQYFDYYLTDVETSCNAIFENNPHITKFDRTDRRIITCDMQYELIHKSNQQPCHFLQGFVEDLADKLQIPLSCNVKRPYLYLTNEEKSRNYLPEELRNVRYWLINSGIKTDYTVKAWGKDNYQSVVNSLVEYVKFVQVGSTEHKHSPLSGVINMIDRTSLRELIVLAYHAEGILTGESFLHHVAAAFSKPCVTLASGFLPVGWVKYHTGTILTHQEKMTCCTDGGCWKSRVVPLGDDDEKDKSLCQFPILESEPIARCMKMIKVEEVLNAILAYYESGLIQNGEITFS